MDDNKKKVDSAEMTEQEPNDETEEEMPFQAKDDNDEFSEKEDDKKSKPQFTQKDDSTKSYVDHVSHSKKDVINNHPTDPWFEKDRLSKTFFDHSIQRLRDEVGNLKDPLEESYCRLFKEQVGDIKIVFPPKSAEFLALEAARTMTHHYSSEGKIELSKNIDWDDHSSEKNTPEMVSLECEKAWIDITGQEIDTEASIIKGELAFKQKNTREANLANAQLKVDAIKNALIATSSSQLLANEAQRLIDMGERSVSYINAALVTPPGSISFYFNLLFCAIFAILYPPFFLRPWYALFYAMRMKNTTNEIRQALENFKRSPTPDNRRLLASKCSRAVFLASQAEIDKWDKFPTKLPTNGYEINDGIQHAQHIAKMTPASCQKNIVQKIDDTNFTLALRNILAGSTIEGSFKPKHLHPMVALRQYESDTKKTQYKIVYFENENELKKAQEKEVLIVCTNKQIELLRLITDSHNEVNEDNKGRGNYKTLDKTLDNVVTAICGPSGTGLLRATIDIDEATKNVKDSTENMLRLSQELTTLYSRESRDNFIRRAILTKKTIACLKEWSEKIEEQSRRCITFPIKLKELFMGRCDVSIRVLISVLEPVLVYDPANNKYSFDKPKSVLDSNPYKLIVNGSLNKFLQLLGTENPDEIMKKLKAAKNGESHKIFPEVHKILDDKYFAELLILKGEMETARKKILAEIEKNEQILKELEEKNARLVAIEIARMNEAANNIGEDESEYRRKINTGTDDHYGLGSNRHHHCGSEETRRKSSSQLSQKPLVKSF